MADAAEQIFEAKGTIHDIQPGSFIGKAGTPVAKYTILLSDGQSYGGFGAAPATIAKGDAVEIKFIRKGAYSTIRDIIKNGASVVPKKTFGGFNRGGDSSKAMMVLAATTMAAHNAAIDRKKIEVSDVKRVLDELQSLVPAQ